MERLIKSDKQPVPMTAGRYFRGLTSYDLLGNIIPGVIILVATMGLLPDPPIPDNSGEYGLFLVIAFSLGAVIQAHASKAVGRRTSFDKTMAGVESLPSLQYPDGDTEGAKDDEDGGHCITFSWQSLPWGIVHPFFGPLCGWKRPPRGSELEDVILANRIWMHLIDTHEIPHNTTSYGVLYHVMSSKVDDIRSPSRATRIQAIRNFHRGMWIASWYSLVMIVAAVWADARLEVGNTIPVLRVEYARASYFEYWTPIWHLVIITAIGVFVFWLLFESTEEDYIEYLFADYAVAIGKEGDTVALADESELTISGDLNTRIEDEPSGASDACSDTAEREEETETD